MSTSSFTMDSTAVAYQLKRVYGDMITTLFARHTQTYNQFEKSNKAASVRPAGAGYYFAIRQSDSGNVGNRGEGEYLPEPIQGKAYQGVITPKLAYATLRMSGLAMEAGKGNVAAFVDVQGDAVMSVYKNLIVDLNRQCHGDGFGKLAVLSAAGTTSTSAVWVLTCDNDLGVRYAKRGMIVDMYTGATPIQVACSQKIQSVNPNSKTITMEVGANTWRTYHPDSTMAAYAAANSSAVDSAAVIVRQGAREVAFATTDTPIEMVGLLGQYDDGTLLATHEGIVVSSYPEFKANMLTNSSVNREISIDLMLAAMDMTNARSSETCNLIRMGLGQRRKYFGLLEGDIRFAPGQLRGGYEQLDFSQNGAVKMVVDPMTQPNKMFFEVDGVIKKYELKPVGWGGFDPNKMHWRPRYDEADMYLSVYADLGVEQRNALTLLDDLTEPDNATMPF